jgi:hypothetical protein
MATNEVIIPSNPKDLERIKKAVVEASDSLLRIDSEREEIKAIAELMAEELQLPKRHFMRMVKVYHKSTYDTEVKLNEDFQALYEAVVK